MADKTKIEWCEATWNPLRGCTRVSEGCRHCYAETVAARFSGAGQPYEGLARWVDRPGEQREARWTGKVQLVEKALDQPLRWKRPRKIFVNSMSDLFHEAVPDEWIDRIFAVMALAPQHTFQILTKRPERMRAWFAKYDAAHDHNAADRVADQVAVLLGRAGTKGAERTNGTGFAWPLRSVWLGVSVEDQATANERIPLLLETPAAVRWISAEPLLGPIRLTRRQERADGSIQTDNFLHGTWQIIDGDHLRYGSLPEKLDWVVTGAEAGPRARPCDIDWIRSLRDQCADAQVAFFWKQHVDGGRKITTPELDGRKWINYPNAG